jgi:hypothetical protein
MGNRQLVRTILSLTAIVVVLSCGRQRAEGDDSAAADYVRLALQHAAYGKSEMGRQLLEAALLHSPDYAPAHWHLGHVQVDGKWTPVDEAQQIAAENESLTTYRALRDEGLDNPSREIALARLCRKLLWDDLAELHFLRVALSPNADRRHAVEAAQKLDLVHVNGALVPAKEVGRQQQAARDVATAIKKWGGPVVRWRQAIESRDAKAAESAKVELAGVDDPAIIPVLGLLVFDSGAEFGQHLVSLLGKFTQHESTQCLVRFAVQSPWEVVRTRAIAYLKERPLHDYVPMLLEGLVAPTRSQYLISRGPAGAIHYQHVFFQRGADGNYLAKREHLAQSAVAEIAPARVRSTNNLTVADAAADEEAQMTFEALGMINRAMQYEKDVARRNSNVLAINEPIFNVLEQTTGEMLGREPADWQEWWKGYNESETGKPTYFAYYPTTTTIVSTYQPTFVEPERFIPAIPPPGRRSCFAAGTPVWTETGIVPIESVKVGDRVLSQDPKTGELAYKVVIRTTAAPPTSGMVRATVEGEAITMTRGHVVWVDGKGWQMAKDLKTGDLAHGIRGAMPIEQTEALAPELVVYNLVVADFNTYFVGDNAVLVHDITYRRPTRAIVPGLLRN